MAVAPGFLVKLHGLPLAAKSIDIRRFFAGLAIPDGGVHIIGGESGEAFITFVTEEESHRALRLSGGALQGMPVRLFPSSRGEMQHVIQMTRVQRVGAVAAPMNQGMGAPAYQGDHSQQMGQRPMEQQQQQPYGQPMGGGGGGGQGSYASQSGQPMSIGGGMQNQYAQQRSQDPYGAPRREPGFDRPAEAPIVRDYAAPQRDSFISPPDTRYQQRQSRFEPEPQQQKPYEAYRSPQLKPQVIEYGGAGGYQEANGGFNDQFGSGGRGRGFPVEDRSQQLDPSYRVTGPAGRGGYEGGRGGYEAGRGGYEASRGGYEGGRGGYEAGRGGYEGGRGGYAAIDGGRRGYEEGGMPAARGGFDNSRGRGGFEGGRGGRGGYDGGRTQYEEPRGMTRPAPSSRPSSDDPVIRVSWSVWDRRIPT